jgi:zinc protease
MIGDWLWILLLGGGVAFGGETVKIPEIPLVHRTLANGLEFYASVDRSTPTVAISVWYHVGSKDDPEERSGFAHLFEHLMFKGTKWTPPETIDRFTEDVGGSNNAYTSDDVTVYHEVVPSNHLERLIWAEADRMSGLTIDDKNFRSERDVVKQEYLQRVESPPYGVFGEEVIKKSFVEHPYRRPTIGNISELNAATLEDVRKFHATYYRPDNATLVVVGDFDLGQLNGWVDAYFGRVTKPAGEVPRVRVKEPRRVKGKRLVEYSSRVPLPAVAVTYLGPAARSEEAVAVEVGQEILAGGESSRLYQRLVYATQLAQSVEFSGDLREDVGLLFFELVVGSGKSVKGAERELFAEIERIATLPVSSEELRKAKNRLITARLRERETCAGRAEAIGRAAVILGDAGRVNEEVSRLQGVTAAEVLGVMRGVFTKENRLTLEYLPESMKGAKE